MAQNENGHDHPPMMFDAEHAAIALQSPVLANSRLKKIREIIADKSLFEWYLREQLGLTEEIKNPNTVETFLEMNIFEFLRFLQNEKNVPLSKSLSFTKQFVDKKDARRLYTVLYELRKELYLASSAEVVAAMFKRYFEDDLSETGIIKASGSFSMFQPDQVKKIIHINNIAAQFNRQFFAFASFQRRDWAMNPQLIYEKILKMNIRDLIKKRIIRGFNVAGSLEEIDTNQLYELNIGKAHLVEHFLQLFKKVVEYDKYAQKNNSTFSLLIHCFENRNSGIWYDALREALENFDADKGPLKIIIAHNAKLPLEWIQFLSELMNKGKIIVEIQSTPPSYFSLVDRFNPQTVFESSEKIQQSNVPLVIGWDGRGVFKKVWPLSSPQLTDAAACARLVSLDHELRSR